jgi:hypothetical protein
MTENEKATQVLAKGAGQLVGHLFAIAVGVVLMIVGVALGVTIVLLPLGVAVGLFGLLLFMWGLFGRIDGEKGSAGPTTTP